MDCTLKVSSFLLSQGHLLYPDFAQSTGFVRQEHKRKTQGSPWRSFLTRKGKGTHGNVRTVPMCQLAVMLELQGNEKTLLHNGSKGSEGLTRAGASGAEWPPCQEVQSQSSLLFHVALGPAI